MDATGKPISLTVDSEGPREGVVDPGKGGDCNDVVAAGLQEGACHAAKRVRGGVERGAWEPADGGRGHVAAKTQSKESRSDCRESGPFVVIETFDEPRWLIEDYRAQQDEYSHRKSIPRHPGAREE